MSDTLQLPQNLIDAIRAAISAAPAGSLTVSQVYDKYLPWCQTNRSRRTCDLAEKYLPLFLQSLPAGMLAQDLRAYHIAEWIDTHPTWGANQKRAVIAAITRPINWAAALGYPGVREIRIKRPEAQKRETKLTPLDFAEIMQAVPEDDPFRELLIFAWEVGCRPQEMRHIEARHVELASHRIQIPAEEAKGKKRWRVIYLSPLAEAMMCRLVLVHPTGKLFRNSLGTAWTADSVCCRFGRLRAKLGKRFAAYDFRHAFATRKLKEGHDPITVANLLGHKDATMLCRHYEGISGDGQHLLAAVSLPDPKK